jgi:hypothetical protein
VAFGRSSDGRKVGRLGWRKKALHGVIDGQARRVREPVITIIDRAALHAGQTGTDNDPAWAQSHQKHVKLRKK